MAPPTNLAISHEYAKLRSPRRISSNGWGRSEILMRKIEEESNGEREEVDLFTRRSRPGMLYPRICANCRTSKTPLWRSGPTGPKSLCNACGIRFRKKQLEAGESKKPFTFFTLNGEITSLGSPSADVMTLEEMKALQKAKQERELRRDVMRRVQEWRRRLLERSRRETAQAAHLLVFLSKGTV